MADLAGSYDNGGIRRWFGRPGTQLGDEAPAAMLHGAWDPKDEGPRRVRQLASALRGDTATPDSLVLDVV